MQLFSCFHVNKSIHTEVLKGGRGGGGLHTNFPVLFPEVKPCGSSFRFPVRFVSSVIFALAAFKHLPELPTDPLTPSPSTPHIPPPPLTPFSPLFMVCLCTSGPLTPLSLLCLPPTAFESPACHPSPLGFTLCTPPYFSLNLLHAILYVLPPPTCIPTYHHPPTMHQTYFPIP